MGNSNHATLEPPLSQLSASVIAANLNALKYYLQIFEKSLDAIHFGENGPYNQTYSS
jgi:hypothetical protein